VALAYQGITYTSREKIIDIGPSTQLRTLRRPSVVTHFGGVALAGGIVLVIIGIKGKK